MGRDQIYFSSLLRGRPHAVARVCGSSEHPQLCGAVSFYQTDCGVLICADIKGLPCTKEHCRSDIFAFHIHSGDRCCGNSEDPFADAQMHYDPADCPHPAHAGDLPPLFGNGGRAFQVVLTDRFCLRDILHRTVIIHDRSDDFTTQPSGNAGKKIACGVIRPLC